MRQSLRQFRPHLEWLESRDTPTNLTATFNAMTHTLSVVGDTSANLLQIQATVGDPTKFTLSSTSDTINHVSGSFVSPTGVQNLAISLLDGDDTVTLVNTPVPIDIKGSLGINSGDGANSVTATDLKVEKNLGITNLTNVSGLAASSFFSLTVLGSLTINNGNGDTNTFIYRNAIGSNVIGGNISVTNGTGADSTQLIDTNVGGNVTVVNGHGNASGVGGNTRIYNQLNTTARSVIRGNVSVSYLDGGTNFWDGIWDTQILGSVAFNHGSGVFLTNFDGYSTTLPVLIRGGLAFTGTGANQITVGTQFHKTGMVVGAAFSVTGGNAAEILTLNKLEADGATTLMLANGNNAVTIDDSVFGGTFVLNTGAGADTVKLATTAGSSRPTTFERAATVNLGAGDDSVSRDGTADANQAILFYGTFLIHHGSGNDALSAQAAKEVNPFGGTISWVI